MRYTFRTPLEERPLFLNRFNPTLKLICALILIVLVFLPITIVGQLSIFILVIGLWISAKLPKKKIWAIIKTILVLFFFIFLINWLVAKNPSVKLADNYQLWGSSWSSLFNDNVVNKLNIGDKVYYWLHGQIWGGKVAEFLTTLKPTGDFVTIKIAGINWYLSYSAPWYSLSSQVLITSISISIKLFCMLSAFSLLVNTTSTMQLTYAFEHFFWPLKWIKVPVVELSYIVAVALRFVPTLFDEANKIINAQACRGIDFRNGRFITKIKAVGSLVVPMFAASISHADKLSDAMEARNFVPRAKRTKYRLYHCSASNWVSFAILICLLALFIYLCASKVIIYPFIAVDCFNI